MSVNWLYSETIDIMGKLWELRYMSAAQYKKLKMAGSRAVTFTNKRLIAFDCSATFPGDNVAAHELTHAFSSEMMVHDLRFDPNQFEEFFCTLVEKRGQEILDMAKPITRKITKYRNKLIKTQGKPEEADEAHKPESPVCN